MGRSVFSIQQLSNLIGKPKVIAGVYASRLVNSGLAVRLIEGKISFSNDDYIIASQLVEPSYISLNSALLYYGLSLQVPKMVECVTTRNTLKYPKAGIIYHKIPPSLFYGFKRYAKGESYFLIAEPEKAVIDGLYLNLISINDFKEYKKKLNYSNIIKLALCFHGKGYKKIMGLIKND